MDAKLSTVKQRSEALLRSTTAPSLTNNERLYCMAAANECLALLALMEGTISPREYLLKTHLPESTKEINPREYLRKALQKSQKKRRLS